MVSVHLAFGQPGAPGIGLTGALVVVVSVTFPFLMSLAGTAVTPLSVTAAGFCPGRCVAPAGFVQIDLEEDKAAGLLSSDSSLRWSRGSDCRPRTARRSSLETEPTQLVFAPGSSFPPS